MGLPSVVTTMKKPEFARECALYFVSGADDGRVKVSKVNSLESVPPTRWSKGIVISEAETALIIMNSQAADFVYNRDPKKL